MQTLHIVPHTHWDREWYRTFQQFRIRLVHLMDNLLALLEKDPYYRHFMLDGQTIVVEDYLAIRPEREEELRRHLLSGRLLFGPWHILPDEFLVSPEAHIRNLLQGERTARRFAPKMRVGYIPDTFGHIGQLPQILRGFGFDTACLWRGVGDQPCELAWQAPDGSTVLLAHLRGSYSNGASLPAADSAAFTESLQIIQNEFTPHTAASHLLVMFGTDHMEPQVETAQAIQYANQHLVNAQAVHSTLPAYLEAVKSELDLASLPIVTGELRSSQRSHLLPGVLSTRMWIKQRNQACETALERWAEPFSLWASLVEGDAYAAHPELRSQERLANPASLLRYAWRLLMENHPHDSICGCSIDQTHAEMLPRFDQVDQIAEEVTRHSFNALSAAADTRPPAAVGEAAAAVLVFNAAAGVQTAPVSLEVQLPPDVQAFELVNAQGESLPHKLLGRQSTSLMNMTIPADEFRGLMRMVKDGRIANIVVRGMQMERRGDTVHLNMVFHENGDPDIEAFQRGKEELEQFFADPEVKFFHVDARSGDSQQVEFLARNVPAFGYRTFWLRPLPAQPPVPLQINPLARLAMPVVSAVMRFAPVQRWLESRQKAAPKAPESAPPYILENEYLRVEASPQDGSLTLLDHRTGLTCTGLHRFVDGADCGDEYNYSPPAQDSVITDVTLRRAHVDHSGVSQTITLDLEMRLPASLSSDRQSRSSQTVLLSIQTRLSLTPGVTMLAIHTEVDNHAEDHRLRVHFSAPFGVTSALFDGHFEIVERPIALPAWDETWSEQPRPEVPQRRFSALASPQGGLMIANRGLPEIEAAASGANQSELALTLLRCVGWLSRDDFSTRHSHAGPFLPTPGAQMPGKHAFDYAVLPFPPGDAAFLQAVHLADAFQTGLRAVSTSLHAGILPAGSLPASASLVTVDSPAFQLSAVKAAEQPPSQSGEPSAAWIVRGYNLTRQPVQINLRPCQLPNRADLTNLAEEAQQALPVQADGSVSLTAGPCQIVTVQFIQPPSGAALS